MYKGFDIKFWGLLIGIAAISISAAVFQYQFVSIVEKVLFGLFVVFIITYPFVKYFKSHTSISYNKDFLRYNKKRFYWNDLECYELTGKFPLLFDRKEGMMLKFKDQKELYIFDDINGNLSPLKRLVESLKSTDSKQDGYSSTSLAAIVNQSFESLRSVYDEEGRFSSKHIDDNLAHQESESVKVFDIENEPFVIYKGIQLLSYRGTMMWVFSLFPIAICIGNFSLTFLFFTVLLILLWAYGISTTMYYFGLSEHYLVVKNHNLFWKRDLYHIETIKEIAFEQKHGKSPYTLRIITTDFENHTYWGGTLSSKKWMQLKDALELKGIKVRNECIYYEPFRFKLFD